MPEIKVISEQREYDKYFKIDKGTVEETAEDGSKEIYDRFKLTRPDAVAIVVYNSSDDTVILVKQHRYPVDDKVDGNILELPAGKIDGDEDPKEAAIREIEEEIGFKVQEGKIGLLNSFFASPGYSTEKIYLYLAFVKNEDKVSEGGGVEGEHENIEIESYGVSEFFDLVADGTICDSKTLIGAQALWHFRNAEVVAAGRQFIEQQRLAHAKKLADQVINEDTETNADEDSK
jgi:nudix-type nucleoside diphosphatase (YffH/AdpP family)